MRVTWFTESPRDWRSPVVVFGEFFAVISTDLTRPGVRHCYVQVIFDDKGDAHAEAVSNFYLRDHPLSPSEEATLLSLGGSPPGTSGGGDKPGRAGQLDEHEQAPHPPNFHRAFTLQQGQRVIADTLLATLNWVYGVQHPSDFTVSIEPTKRRLDREMEVDT